MNVIVEIDGRQAIPVRAIPLLTNWTTMGPDELAKAFARHGIRWQSYELQAFRTEKNRTLPISPAWWRNFCRKELEALADDIKARAVTYANGYRDWQRASLLKLPAGSFVWKDEYESAYARAFGPDGTLFISDLGEVMPEDDQAKHVALDYDPFVPEAGISDAVMEGFEPMDNASQSDPPTSVAQPEPTETTEQRQDRRLKLCVDGGLTMDKTALSRLPKGVAAIAAREGVTRQAFSADLKAALKRQKVDRNVLSTMHRA